MIGSESVGGVFESFYTKHVLRDVFAKMAPGALLLIGIRVAGWSFHQAILDMGEANLGAWLVFAALAWLAGLALQGIGELTGRCHRKVPMQYFTWKKGQSRIDAESVFHAKVDRLDSSSTVTVDQKQRFERFVVIKEAAGNACMALFILIPTIAVSRREDLPQLAAGLVVAVVAFIGLWVLHIDNVRRQDIVLDASIKKMPEEPNENA